MYQFSFKVLRYTTSRVCAQSGLDPTTLGWGDQDSSSIMKERQIEPHWVLVEGGTYGKGVDSIKSG